MQQLRMNSLRFYVLSLKMQLFVWSYKNPLLITEKYKTQNLYLTSELAQFLKTCILPPFICHDFSIFLLLTGVFHGKTTSSNRKVYFSYCNIHKCVLA